MYLGTALLLIAGGLILALAVTADPIPGVDLQMIGWILFVVGLIGAILELAVFRPRRTATYGTTTGTTREVIRERDRY